MIGLTEAMLLHKCSLEGYMHGSIVNKHSHVELAIAGCRVITSLAPLAKASCKSWKIALIELSSGWFRSLINEHLRRKQRTPLVGTVFSQTSRSILNYVNSNILTANRMKGLIFNDHANNISFINIWDMNTHISWKFKF